MKRAKRPDRRQFISSDEASRISAQHMEPCSDCPFSVYSLNGWLGGKTPEDFIHLALSDDLYPCHALLGPKREKLQCAGLAVFRANMCKISRDKTALRLPPDRVRVFLTPQEFIAHHEAKWIDEENEPLIG